MNANSSPNPVLNCDTGSPFHLDNETAFQNWKKLKLRQRLRIDPLTPITLDSVARAGDAARTRIEGQLEAYNFILFEANPDMGHEEFLRLNQWLGLHRLDKNPGAESDAVTLLRRLNADDSRAKYIPFTDRAMNWHTDGYYNPANRTINAFSLFCVSPASDGGGNFLLDHEYAYLLLRDSDPDLVAALMAPDFIRVPANELNDSVSRSEQSGPVFAVEPGSGRLQMRYTSRPRHVIWPDDDRSLWALKLLREILSDSDAVIELKLARGQGLSCNNILHGRHAYRDAGETGRLVYRARFLDSINPR